MLRSREKRVLNRRLCAIVVLLASGCGSPGTTTRSVRGTAHLESTEPREALEEIDEFLQDKGWERVGPALRNPQMPARGIVAYALNARSGICYTAVAIASLHADLNMVVVDPLGRKVAHNVAPDPYPWATFCPAYPGHHIVRLQMGDTASESIYALYSAPQGKAPPLTTFFPSQSYEPGGKPPVVEPDRNTKRRMRALDEALKQEGFVRPAEPRAVSLSRGAPQDIPVNLRSGYCYAFAAFNQQVQQQMALSVLNGEGRPITEPRKGQEQVLLRLCPGEPGRHVLRLETTATAVPAFVAAWARDEAEQGSTRGDVINPSTSDEEIEANLRVVRAEMEARGYSGLEQTGKASLEEGQSRTFAIPLKGNTCYAIVAVGDNGVRNLDLAVRNPVGTLIDRDFEIDRRPTIRACPVNDGDHRIDVHMVQGSGRFAYGAFPWPRGTHGPFGLQGLVYLRLAEITSLLTYEGYEPSVEHDPIRGSVSREGRPNYHEIDLPGDACVAVVVVGGDGVYEVASALSLEGEMLAEDQDRSAFTSVRYCTTKPGRYLLNVRTTHGAGNYFSQVFRRQ